MSSERYEIRGKIGQGGVGSVYQAYDTQLNREVAIKRVLAEGGYEDQAEATQNLLKEATALSSVQHPHIVTVYDAGIDADGPYVVMELIHGRTLDQMVERGTLTWDDLREVALQTQEALIAAQDLDLVHRDLKPSNVMVCWLPSGKFQVKIVDFGLAKFSSTPSLQTIDHGDAVFGSIFFMAPEQFERTPLDKRTDMYAMGCLYYYALTGEYPFTGDTAAAVMASHLQHHVEHLSEVRPDIPQWGADWIMWHIERNMEDRPIDARESLERFLILDKQSTQPITVSATAPTHPVPDSNAPKFLFPGTNEPTVTDETSAAPAPVAATTPPLSAAPAPLQPTPMAAPVQPTTPAPPQPISLQEPEPTPEPEPIQPQTGPQPISPPDSSVSLHTKAHLIATAPQSATGPQPNVIATAPTSSVQAAPVQPTPVAQPDNVVQPIATPPISLTSGTAVATPTPPPVQPEQTTPDSAQVQPVPTNIKKSLPTGAKWTIIGMLTLVVVVAVFVLTSLNSTRQEAKKYNALMERAAKLEEDGTLKDGLEVSKDELVALLNKASSMEDNKKRFMLRKCLAFAKGSGFDADPIIVKHVTEASMTESIRSDLLQYVMVKRTKSSNITPLLNYAKSATEVGSATQAIKAAQASTRGSHADEYFGDFLELINYAEAESARVAAGKAAGELVAISDDKAKFASIIIGSYQSAIEDSAKFALLRLLGTAGGNEASKIVKKALASDDPALQNAAISALGQWADDSEFENLIAFIASAKNPKLRNKAFTAGYSFLRFDRERDSEHLANLWQSFAASAQSPAEKCQVIDGLANQKDQWAIPLLDDYAKDGDDAVIDKAERAKKYLERRIRSNKSEDE